MLPVKRYAGTLIITLNVLLGFALFGAVPSLWKSHDRVINQASNTIRNSGALSEDHLTAYSVSNAWSPPHGMGQNATPLDVMQDSPRRVFRTMLWLCRSACVLLLLNSILVLWHRWEDRVNTNQAGGRCSPGANESL